jgi:hypothetical protein
VIIVLLVMTPSHSSGHFSFTVGPMIPLLHKDGMYGDSPQTTTGSVVVVVVVVVVAVAVVDVVEVVVVAANAVSQSNSAWNEASKDSGVVPKSR